MKKIANDRKKYTSREIKSSENAFSRALGTEYIKKERLEKDFLEAKLDDNGYIDFSLPKK